MLYPKQVKRFFKKTTGKNISSRGLIKLINHFESEMEEMVELCVQQHLELNEMKRFHGLYVKKRVDREAIVKAIEFINNKRDTPTKTNREVLENIGDIL